ncbi:MAG: hypothetical protein IT204_07640 [Fimbriimonadaceae bacterium]|nr:hypothetical protein [Fimbriimonadaceae bacterium]
MLPALLALLVAALATLWAGTSVPSAWAGQVGLLTLVLLASLLRSWRMLRQGTYKDRDFGYYLGGTAAAALGLAWLGEWLGLGRLGTVPVANVAVQVVLCGRILGQAEALWTAAAPPAVTPGQASGPAVAAVDDRKAGS